MKKLSWLLGMLFALVLIVGCKDAHEGHDHGKDGDKKPAAGEAKHVTYECEKCPKTKSVAEDAAAPS